MYWSQGNAGLCWTELLFISYKALWEREGRTFEESFGTGQQRSAVIGVPPRGTHESDSALELNSK